MCEKNNNLSKKDAMYREQSLNGNILLVILFTGAPLALYQGLSQLFKILDTIMASHISAESVSAVAYMSQLLSLLSAVSGGLSVGAGIHVSRAFGEGDYQMVQKRVSTVYFCSVVFALVLMAVIIPSTVPFLRMAATPEELIDVGAKYFIIEIFTLAVSFINNVYIAVERSRGNNKRILVLNMLVLVSKLLLTAFFIYVMKSGLDMLAIATLISQMLLLAAAIYNGMAEKSVFGFSISSISFKKEVSGIVFIQSIPVMMEKFLFSVGKAVVNAMSTVYGGLMVGALGISNTLGGISTAPQNGFQDGASAVISQNFGAKKYERVLRAFASVALINVTVGTVLCVTTLLSLNHIIVFFDGGNENFRKMIVEVYTYEAVASIPLGINAAVMALLYGLGKTKMTLILNFSRVFVFRIPVLYFLQNFTDAGDKSIGIVMMISNLSTTAMAVIVGAVVIRGFKKKFMKRNC